MSRAPFSVPPVKSLGLAIFREVAVFEVPPPEVFGLGDRTRGIVGDQVLEVRRRCSFSLAISSISACMFLILFSSSSKALPCLSSRSFLVSSTAVLIAYWIFSWVMNDPGSGPEMP